MADTLEYGEEANTLAKSEEMLNFYRTLAAVQTNAIFEVMSGRNEAEMRERAIQATKRLAETFPEGCRCFYPKVWNGTTGKCE